MFDVFTELQEAKIAFKEHLSGKELTTYRAGGKVSVVAYPESVAALKKLVGIAMETGTKFMPIGLGSNVLIDEKGFDGILISSIGFRDIGIRGNRITAGSGVSLKRALEFSVEHDFSAFEELTGIPASVGGMAKCNAGSFGKEMGDIVASATVFDFKTGETQILPRSEIAYAYRSSGKSFSGKFILSVEVEGAHSERVLPLSRYYRDKRAGLQPGYPSLGSVFKRTPDGISLGYYIDKAGLKGVRSGGAEISDKHAGFIVNRGGGSAGDYLALKELARETVMRKFGVKAEDEIIVIGNNE